MNNKENENDNSDEYDESWDYQTDSMNHLIYRGITDFITIDGFDDCIIGCYEGFSSSGLVYSKNEIIQTMIERDGMTLEDALEFYDFNIAGAYVGNNMPVFLTFTEGVDDV